MGAVILASIPLYLCLLPNTSGMYMKLTLSFIIQCNLLVLSIDGRILKILRRFQVGDHSADPRPETDTNPRESYGVMVLGMPHRLRSNPGLGINL